MRATNAFAAAFSQRRGRGVMVDPRATAKAPTQLVTGVPRRPLRNKLWQQLGSLTVGWTEAASSCFSGDKSALERVQSRGMVGEYFGEISPKGKVETVSFFNSLPKKKISRT